MLDQHYNGRKSVRSRIGEIDSTPRRRQIIDEEVQGQNSANVRRYDERREESDRAQHRKAHPQQSRGMKRAQDPDAADEIIRQPEAGHIPSEKSAIHKRASTSRAFHSRNSGTSLLAGRLHIWGIF